MNNSIEVRPVQIPHRTSPPDDRMNVNISVIHEHWPDQAVSTAWGHSYLLCNNEQRFVREMKINDAGWVPLELGWFDKIPAGLLVVKNMVGHGMVYKPSEDDINKMKNQFILLRTNVDSSGIIIRPKVPMLIEAEDIKSVRLKSTSGIIPAVISIYPR